MHRLIAATADHGDDEGEQVDTVAVIVALNQRSDGSRRDNCHATDDDDGECLDDEARAELRIDRKDGRDQDAGKTGHGLAEREGRKR